MNHRIAGRCLLFAALLWVPLLALAQEAELAEPAAAASAAAPEASVIKPIPLVPGDAQNIRVASAPDAWGGPRSAADTGLSDQVTHYAIEATLDPDTHTVTGQQRLQWRNRSDQIVDTVYLHMYLNAFEGPGSTLMSERQMLSQSGRSRGAAVLKDGEWGHIDLDRVTQNGQAVTQRWVHPDGGPETDHTVLALELPEPVPAHGTLELDMAFTSQLPRVVIRTGWWDTFHLVAQWFPKMAVLELPGERGATEVRWNAHEFHYHSEFYADFGSYDVKLTVPEDYVVGAVGEEVGEPTAQDGKRTHHFVQDHVVDFAWVAAPDFKTLDTTWTGPGSPEVKVRVIYPPEYEVVAEPVQKATLDSLEYFSKTLGPYPYRTVTAVVPPYNAAEAGGMEYPTFFTASYSRDYTPGTISEYMIDFVTIHEFGHGYFMGILATNEFEEPFLDEGLNEYWDQRMLADREQMVYPVTRLMHWLGFRPGVDPFVLERLMGVLGVGDPADSLDANSWDRMSNGSYGSVYSRSAVTMRTIENLVGHDVMEKAMKLYYERWKFRHPSAADLRDALADGTGQAELIHSIFDSQVYGTQKVDASVVSIENTELVPQAGTFIRDGERVTVTEDEVKQQIKDARKAWKDENKDAKHGGPYPWRTVVTVRRTGAPIPRSVRVNFADDTGTTMAWDDGSRWKRFSFEQPVKAVSVEIDPDNKVLLDNNIINNSRAVETDSSAARRYGADWSALMSTVFSFLVTL